MKKFTFLLFFMISGVANAGIITVDYEVSFLNGSFWGNGTFSGVDSSSDGFLTFDELISFSGSNNIEGLIVDLTTLNDVGDFNILTDTWINNAIRVSPLPADAWFSWNNLGNSIRPDTFLVAASQRSPEPVPVPGTLLLFGFGLAGLGFARRFKAAVKV